MLAIEQGPVMCRSNDKVRPSGPARKTAVNVALPVGDDDHRSRPRETLGGPLGTRQPTNALLFLQSAGAARGYFNIVIAGPNLGIQKTQDRLSLAIDRDQRVDEESGRSTITTRPKPITIGLAARKIDLGRVLGTTIRRPTQAAAVRAAIVCTISRHVT